jgi:phenylacetic acid degradation operon negative regulatory protein
VSRIASGPDAPLAPILRHFRNRRPLRAGSLLVTILGDAILPRGGMVSLGSLIALCAPFGIPERLARTSVGRLAQSGLLIATRQGRQSFYALSPAGQSEFAAATQRIYAGPPASWDRQWTFVFLPDTGSSRSRVKSLLTWSGFGQLMNGVFVHPSCTLADARTQLDRLGLASGIAINGRCASRQEDRRLAAEAWNFGDLNRYYAQFLRLFAPLESAIGGRLKLSVAGSFVLRTLLVHEYRRIHLRDPMLPAELVAGRSAGLAAHRLCRTLYSKVFATAELHLNRLARGPNGPLPAASHEARSRFKR